MGLYDRDYYRDEPPRFWDRMTGHRATSLLVGLSVVVFLAQLFTGDARSGFDPIQKYGLFHLPSILNGEVWRVITANFIQPGQGFLPFIFGMLLLYFVGLEVETIYGPTRLIIFFLFAGIVISLVKMACGVFGFDPNGVSGGTGAPIAALLVLFAFHYPQRTIMLFFVIPMPIWLLVTIFLGLQILVLIGEGINQRVVAMLTAAVFGAAYFKTHGAILNWVESLMAVLGSRPPRRRLKTYQPPDHPDEDLPSDSEPEPEPTRARPATATATASRASVDEHLEAKLDQVLEKVARSGRESLSPEENEILLRASEVYKRRRS